MRKMAMERVPFCVRGKRWTEGKSDWIWLVKEQRHSDFFDSQAFFTQQATSSCSERSADCCEANPLTQHRAIVLLGSSHKPIVTQQLDEGLNY